MKKTFTLLGIILLASMSAWAQNSFTVNGLNYLETGVGTGKVKITGYTIEPTGVFDIPETVSPSSGGSYTVTKIADEVFANCTNLTEVIFPSTITEIGEYAFYYSRDLTSITCYASTPPAMGENAFGTADKTIPVYVPANALSSYQSNADWSEFTRTTYITFISNNLEYKLLYTSPNQAEIIGYTTAPTGVLNIPATVSHKGKDYTVITIAEEVFSECSGLTELVFSESLRTIGAHAFHYCQNITSITCYATTPPNVGTSAFANTDETIPVYVPAEALSSYQSNAGWSVFTNLQAIVTEFTVGGLTYNVIDQIAKTVEVINFTDELPSTVTIPATVSYGGKNYTVTTIASSAFYQNQTITEITISEGITSIGSSTFGRCFALTTVNIPASLTYMGEYVFDGCTSLTQINVNEANTAYCSENGILFNKDKTTLICYPAGKTETTYTIPSSVTVIGVNAFSDCTTLTSITLPASVTTLEKFAFFNCFRLTKIMVLATTPPTVAHLDAFYSVNSDIPVYVPASSLAAYQAAAVWKEFTNLQAILTGRFTVDNLTYQHQETDPGTVELTNCGNLSGSALDIPATVTYDGNEYTVTSISNGALRDLSLTTITIPHSVNSISGYVFSKCSALTQINVDESNTTYCSENGILFNKDKTTLVCYPAGKPESTYTVPSSVTTIGKSAFNSCSTLTQVILPEGLTTIESEAFYECSSLAEINIPASVTTIEIPMFYGETSLTQINVDEANTTYCSENDILFNKDKTTLIYYPSGKPETVYNIPEGVTHLLPYSFHNKHLSQITLPGSMQLIDDAFRHADLLKQIICLAVIPPALQGDAFCDIDENKTPVYVPAEALAAYQANNSWRRYNNLHAMDSIITVDNLTYALTGNTAQLVGHTAELSGIVEIPASITDNNANYNITAINWAACWSVETITEVSISNTVTIIRENAFHNAAALNKLTIGSGVTNIESGAFALCEGLTEMTVLATMPPTLGENVFENVNRNIPVYVPSRSLQGYLTSEVWKEFNLQVMSTSAMTNPSMPENISLQGGMLHNPQQLHLTLYDMQGRQVYSGNDATISQPAGVYVIRCNGASGKVLF